MYTDFRRRAAVTEYALVAVVLPVWLALSRVVPVLASMPGFVVLSALVPIAFTLGRGPAILAVAIGAVGHEFIRLPAPWTLHLTRMLVIGAVGGACVALAGARAARLVAAQRYEALFERHPLPMFVFDAETQAILSPNAAAVSMYGYTPDEFCRLTLRDLEVPVDGAAPGSAPDAAARGGSDAVRVTRHRNKAGQLLDVQVRSQTVPFQGRPAVLVFVENITDQRELEAQLRQAQKMEAVGRLAGGVAHDFNNLLTAIRGYATLVLDGLPDDDARKEDVIEIEKASARASELTRQLLAFSRKQILQEQVMSLNDSIDDLVPMLRRLTGDQVQLRVLTAASGHVKADPAQMQQVLMNLVVNARDAIGSGPGTITIETADVVLDELYLKTHSSAMTGPHVVLAVSDTGHGMTPDVQARAFEPFFTTKAAGEGTGLGLSTVYGIVKQSGGHIWIYSEVGHGTTIKVYLPRTTDARIADVTSGETPRHVVSTPTSVLVVEDEATVRALLVKLLSRAGYTVYGAATAAEAAHLVQASHIDLDLLITDVVLSRESGRELAELILRIQPDARVLYISGYTDDGVVRHGILTHRMPFLQKPFTAAALLDKVAAVLAAPVPPAR